MLPLRRDRIAHLRRRSKRVDALPSHGAARPLSWRFCDDLVYHLSGERFAALCERLRFKLCSILQVVPPEAVGEAQGVLASMKAIMEGVGPMSFAFAMTVQAHGRNMRECARLSRDALPWQVFETTSLPGAPWIFGAGCMMVSSTCAHADCADRSDDSLHQR